MRRSALGIVLFLAACGDDGSPPADAGLDAGPGDTGGPDGATNDAPSGFDAGMVEYPQCDPRAREAACPAGERCALVIAGDRSADAEFLCRFDGSLREGDACVIEPTSFTLSSFVDQCLDGTFCVEVAAGPGQTCARICADAADCNAGEVCLHFPAIEASPLARNVGVCRTPDPCDPIARTGCPAGEQCHFWGATLGGPGSLTFCDEGGVRGAGESCFGIGQFGCAAGFECSFPIRTDGTLDFDGRGACTEICDPGDASACGDETCVERSPSAGYCTRTDPEPVVADMRPANVFVPSAHDGSTPLPLIVALHGFTGTGEQMDVGFRIRQQAERLGAYALFPDGTRNSMGQTFWNATPACCDMDRSGVDDSGYIGRLVDAMAMAYPVDPDRVFAIGASNGGYMAYRLACDHADVFAAIVSQNGSTFADEADCMASEPVSVLQIHGTMDANVSYTGMAGRYPGAVETVTRWATRAGCDLGMATDGAAFDYDLNIDGPEATPRLWSTGCATGVEAELWTCTDSTHFLRHADGVRERVFDWLMAHGR